MTVRSTSIFRAGLRGRSGPMLGTWVKLAAPESVELLALAGFEFVVIDLEHSPMGLEAASGHISTALLAGVSPIVRVPALDAGMATRLLDAGAEGIMLPHVDSVADARRFVDACRFPPLGSRGVGSTSRAGHWGAMPRDAYLRYGREEVVLVAQLESAAAVAAAQEIGALPGIDALLIGTADLSVSEQVPEGGPELGRLVRTAVAAAEAAGVPIGCAGPPTAEAVATAAATGFDFVLLGNDAGFLGAAARAAVLAGADVRYP